MLAGGSRHPPRIQPFSGVGAFFFVDQSAFIARGRPGHTLCRASELAGGRGYASRNPGKSLPLSLRQRNTCALCWPGKPVRVPTLKAKLASHEATGQLFEEMMATYHSLGIAGKVAGKFIHHPVGPSDSSGRNVVWNLPRCPQQCVLDGRRCWHTPGILSSSLSLMAQGLGVTTGAESGILARPVSMTMLAFLTTSWWDPRQTLADSTLRQRCRENRAAQTCDGHCGPIVKEGCDLTFAW